MSFNKKRRYISSCIIIIIIIITNKEIKQIEKIQRNAARFVKRDYSMHSNSVTKMMNDLNWRHLQLRRRDSRLVLLYKIINNLVAIPTDNHLSYKSQNYNLRTSNKKTNPHQKYQCGQFQIFILSSDN